MGGRPSVGMGMRSGTAAGWRRGARLLVALVALSGLGTGTGTVESLLELSDDRSPELLEAVEDVGELCHKETIGAASQRNRRDEANGG